MKAVTPLYILIAAMGLSLTGCGKTEPQKATPPTEKGTVQTAIDGFTGKTAVDYGLKAKKQIQAASEARQRDHEEAMQ